MRKVIISLLLLAASLPALQAQNTATTAPAAQQEEDLDAKYTQGLLAVGTEAPDFTIKDEKTGKTKFSLRDMRPKMVDGVQQPGVWTIIDFWATWCPDCRREMPTLQEIYKKYKNKVEVVGVSFDTDKNRLDKYCKDNKIAWQQYSELVKWKETKISKEYNISWLPTMYLIDPEGNVAYTTVLAKNMMQKIDELEQAGKLYEFRQEPYFPGGKEGFSRALANTMKYPALAQKYQAQAKVVLNFVVDTDGNIEDIKVAKYETTGQMTGTSFNKLTVAQQAQARSQVRTLFEQEAIRALTAMGKWAPGRYRGKVVKAKYRAPFVFRMK